MTDVEIAAIGRAFNIWRGIVGRCTSPVNGSYENYGARGICICDRWRRSFPAFLRDVGLPPGDLSIDRINNDGNYEPGNVRWATKTQQNRNRRTTVFVTINGVRKPLAEHAEDYGITEVNLRARIARGFTPEQAVGIAARTNPLTTELTHGGVTLPFKVMAARHGLTTICLHKRLDSGMPLAEALTTPLSTRGGATSLQRVTVDGETNTIKHFAKKYGVEGKVYARLKLGWTLKEALGLKPRRGGRGAYQMAG